MIHIREKSGLPFVEANIVFREKSIRLKNILIDTGYAGTIFNVNRLEEIGVKPEPDDITHTIQGIGGLEFVYTKNIDEIVFSEEIRLKHFLIELGSMDYGLDIDGIIGFDALKKLGVTINLKESIVYL